MDIVCASCGQHFNSVESAKEHNGHCKGSPMPFKGQIKSKISKQEEPLSLEATKKVYPSPNTSNPSSFDTETTYCPIHHRIYNKQVGCQLCYLDRMKHTGSQKAKNIRNRGPIWAKVLISIVILVAVIAFIIFISMLGK